MIEPKNFVKVLVFKFKIHFSLINIVWALPVVGVIRLLSNFLLIKIGNIGTTRIGHLAEDSANLFLDYSLKQKKTLNIFYFWPDNRHANSFLKLLIRRNLVVVPSWLRHVNFWNKKFPGHEKFIIPIPKNRDVLGRFYQNDHRMKFNSREHSEALHFLKEIGLNENQKFILIHIRDSVFLSKDKANLHPTLKKFDPWKHHSYRDSNISDYEESVKYLLSEGYFVIRMGKVQEKKLNIFHKHFFDYSFSKYKSDFLDVWLFANANALISSVTGPICISNIYNVPTLEINHLPSMDIRSFANTLSAPKKLWNIKFGRWTTLQEHLAADYYVTDDYSKNDLLVVDLTSVEILDITKEFVKRLNNNWYMRICDKINEQVFWNTLRNCPDFYEKHNWISPSAHISTEWLRLNLAD
jgi:putative glycosyltransferase (TIGR04372 family)